MLRPLFILCLSFAWMACAYANGIQGPFVYEDGRWLSQVEQPANNWAFPGRALTTASNKATTRAFYTFDTKAFHVVNIAIHAATGLAVYAAVTPLGSPLSGALATWLFLLHPVNSEAVQYLSARGDLLLTLFTVIGVAIALRSRTWVGMTAAVACAILAGYSKEYGVVALPLVAFTVLQWRPEWRRVTLSQSYSAVAGYAALAIVTGLVIGAAATRLRALYVFDHSMQRVAVAELVSIVAWPFGRLTIDHDPLMLSTSARLAYEGGLCLAMGLALAFGSRASRWMVGWGVLAIGMRALVPTGDLPTEHHLYLFTAGVCMWVGLVIDPIVQRVFASDFHQREMFHA